VSTPPAAANAADLFRRTYGRDPDGVFSAPGRVNLIGEHTDYSGGLVLPFAIDARAYLAAGRSDTETIRVASAQKPGQLITVPLEDLEPGSPAAAGWPGYLLGAIWSLQDARYPIEPVDLVLDSEVPSGAGLSSSAAVECATVLAVSALAGDTLDPLTVARIAQHAENDFVGVPCGPMDQTASAACREGAVLLFDTRAGTTEDIPFHPASHGLTVLVIDTRVAHSLADGEYGRRRAACERAATILNVPSCATSRSTTYRPPSTGYPTTSCAAGSGTWSPRTTG
jgi:galactokinase